MLLAVNTIIQLGDDPNHLERILWIDDTCTSCYVIHLFTNRFPVMKGLGEIQEGLLNGGAQIVKDDPIAYPVCVETLSEKEREFRDRAWEVIQAIASIEHEPEIFISQYRNQLIRRASITYGISEKSIGRYLKNYWRKGKTMNALIPSFSNRGGSKRTPGELKIGRPRKYDQSKGINVTDEIKQIFRIALDRYYYTKSKGSLKYAYEQCIKEFFAIDYKIQDGVKIPIIAEHDSLPTFTQFKYFFQKENSIKKVVSTRQSPKKYELNYRAVLGNSTAEAIGPGSKFLLDGTTFDIYLVSRYNRNWIIGRPCLYYVQDVFSHLIVGVYVGLESGWMSAAMAISNAAEDKVEFLRSFDIQIQQEQWPANHLCETIVGDRGELFTKQAETMIQNLNIKVQNTSSYRGDLKGILERQFRLTTDLVKPLLPGAINPDFRERGGRDYRLDAKLDLHQFSKIILKCVLYHNNHHYLSNYSRGEMMIEDDVDCIPIELWNWGIKHRSGKLREVPKDIVMLHLLPTAEASVSFQGICFRNMYYSCPTAIKERWFEQARFKGGWRIPVSFDPRNLRVIYIRGIGEKGYEVATLLEHQYRYQDRTMDEINYLIAYENMMKAEQSKKALQPKVDLLAEIESIVKDAEKETRLQMIVGSKAEKLRGIRTHRNFEKQANRENEAFLLHDSDTRGSHVPVRNDGEREQSDYFGDISLFRQKRKERFDE